MDKRYILHPTKEEYFKTKHPIAISSVLIPMILYYLIVVSGDDTHNWWIIVGFFGSIIMGVGIAYAFAVIRKIYEKVLIAALWLLFGGTLLVVSLFFLF